MPTTPPAVLLTPDGSSLLEAVEAWLGSAGIPRELVRDPDALMARCLRGRPRILVIDARDGMELAEQACRRVKSDSYSAVVPTVVLCRFASGDMERAFAFGADEVLTEQTPPAEAVSRLNATLARSDRDVHVHPSTRLPGTDVIEACITSRMATDAPFAVCYADLDHFKEFNDRYGYHEGDRVIRVLARILHDVVKGLYFVGKDRRGQLHRGPLMTLSIGVVTNERRRFTSAWHVSELATEMKAYAKSLNGSVFSVDRRAEPVTPDAPRAGLQTPPSLRYR